MMNKRLAFETQVFSYYLLMSS